MELPEKISECAFYNKNIVCSSDNIVNKMKDFLNNSGISISNNNKENIVEKIKDITNCDNESCVLKNLKFSNFVGNEKIEKELEENFKPDGPALTFDLLNNINIDDVLEQFTKAYKKENFLHIPFQMRDFAKYEDEYRRDRNLNTIDLSQKFNDGMKCFGVVINTDYSTGRGIHWFSIFGDFRKKPYTIEYFNSSGNLPIIEISIWMKNIKTKLSRELDVEINDIIVSRIAHQTGDNACGVYSLYYILSRLEKIPYEYFASNRIPDELMDTFRQVFFRWS